MPESRRALIEYFRAAARDTSILLFRRMLTKGADDLEAQVAGEEARETARKPAGEPEP
jgi:hypothetical protein